MFDSHALMLPVQPSFHLAILVTDNFCFSSLCVRQNYPVSFTYAMRVKVFLPTRSFRTEKYQWLLIVKYQDFPKWIMNKDVPLRKQALIQMTAGATAGYPLKTTYLFFLKFCASRPNGNHFDAPFGRHQNQAAAAEKGDSRNKAPKILPRYHWLHLENLQTGRITSVF